MATDLLNASPAIAGLSTGSIPFIDWMGVKMSGIPGGITGQVVSNYTAPPEGVESAPVAPAKQDNTLLFIGGGIAVAVVIGAVFLMRR